MTETAQRSLFHQLIYSLLYPAFLGAFIYAIAQDYPVVASEWSVHDNQPWGPLFAIYFALQFVRLDHSRTDSGYLLFDAAEMSAMIVLFDGLGYFNEEPHAAGSPGDFTLWVMVFVILCPVLKRVIEYVCSMKAGASKMEWTWDKITLTILSILAATALVLWLCGMPQGYAYWVIAMILLAYFGVLVALDRKRAKEPVKSGHGEAD